jgi:aspartyl-tRNA(Asn)/glutamyl-tRNA(Gln) amidotransferase subunit A
LFSYSSIEQYHNLLIKGGSTCESAVAFFLTQIEATKSLNIYVNVYAKEALEQARLLDNWRAANPNKPLGKLHGVVVSLKDVICYKHHPVTAASKMLAGFESQYNATVVEKLLAEEAIIIGHVNCDEFAMGSGNENSVYGATLNGINPQHIPGGSSGASAVAVQQKTCMISLGSDTGGSVRQPADHCGVVGYKPSYGKVSRYGLIAYASSFDQIGILAHNVADVSATLEVIAGADAFDTTLDTARVTTEAASTSGTKKLAYFTEAIQHPMLDAEIKKSFLAKVESIKANGHQVAEISMPLLEYLVPTYYVLTTAEASSNLNRYDGVRYGHRTNKELSSLNEFYIDNRTEGFGKEVKKRIMLGSFVLSSGYYDAYFTKAQQVRQLLVQFTQTVFEQFDFILMPNVPSTAPKLGDKDKDPMAVYLADIYTVFANLVGIPAIALPLGVHSNGLPYGIQCLAASMADEVLLRFANTHLE